MLRLILPLMLAATLALPSHAATETMFQMLLRVAGITATPAQMRGPSDDLEPGDIWVVTLGGLPAPMTTGGGYSSPIFSPMMGASWH